MLINKALNIVVSPIQFSVAMYRQLIVKTTKYNNIRVDAISVVGISAQVL